MKLTILNWMRYLTGRYAPSTIKFLNKNKVSLAYKLGYGDYVWSKMNGGYEMSKGFRYHGIPLRDRLNDHSTKISTFFNGIRENEPAFFAHSWTAPKGFGSKLKK